jgi:hypothetical protein
MLDAVCLSRMHVQNGWSCLHVACQQAHLEVFKYLRIEGGEELLLTTNVSADVGFFYWM